MSRDPRRPQITDPEEAAGIMRGLADAKAGRVRSLADIDADLASRDPRPADPRERLREALRRYDQADRTTKGIDPEAHELVAAVRALLTEAPRVEPPPALEKMARIFAMEYLTGHYRPLRDDEHQRYDQLTVVMLAFASQIRRREPPPSPLAAVRAFIEGHIEATIVQGDEFRRGWNSAMHNVRNKVLEVEPLPPESCVEPPPRADLTVQQLIHALQDINADAEVELIQKLVALTAAPVPAAGEEP